jgi:carbon-monoxide dehydrogenase small subunit
MTSAFTRTVELEVNGAPFARTINVRRHLADFLRHDLGLTGTHVGCEHGVCGACTVLVDGQSVRSCLMLAVQAHGKAVTTIEGLAPAPGVLHPLQAALHKHHGLQCGFCTPGMLTTLVELLNTTPHPTADEVRIAISGNLCRCTGYEGIVAAALEAAEVIAASKEASK